MKKAALLPRPAPRKPRKKRSPPSVVRRSARVAGRFARGGSIKLQQRILIRQLGIAREGEVISDEALQAYLRYFDEKPMMADHLAACLALFGWLPDALPVAEDDLVRESNKEFWQEYEEECWEAAAEPGDEEEGQEAAAETGDEEEGRGAAVEPGNEEEGWDNAVETGDETTEGHTDRTDGDSGGNPEEAQKKRKAKMPRRDRKPQVLANITDAFRNVSESGLPLEPSEVAKGYNMQLGCIVRESVSINTKDIRSEANAALAKTLIQKLHQRYTFPEPFNKKVDSLALTKMSIALSSWRTRVKRKIEAGDSWEKIRGGVEG
ncbi:hypothetical protein ACQ4PT_053176 [Festuca glaucescens]